MTRRLSEAPNLRRGIRERVGFKFWVRMFRDGKVWVAPEPGSVERQQELMGCLREMGFKPVAIGKPGTSGEWVVEVGK